VSEDIHRSTTFIEYRASKHDQIYVTYEKPAEKCYYATDFDTVPIDFLNSFVTNIQLFNLSAIQSINQQIFDKQMDKLYKDSNLNAWISYLPLVQSEPILIFTETRNGLIKYILSEFLFIEVHSISFHYSNEVDSIVHELKSKCISLDDELKIPARKAVQRITNEKSQLPWFLNKSITCELPHVRDDVACGPRERVEKKTCIFLHGSGELEVREPTNTREDYWGNVHEYTPQCSERWFIWTNTKIYGWDSHDLQKQYCELAAFHNKTFAPGTPAVIKDTIIFTHSMANLILAAGLKNGYCSWGEGSSWYSLNSPYGGSVASVKLSQICYDYYHHIDPGIIKKIIGYIAETGLYCDPNTKKAYHAYNTLIPGYCDADGQCLYDLEKIIRDHVKGAICGSSSIGLFSKYSILLTALAQLVDYQEDNDGMVGLSSCERYHSGQFRDEASNLWYASGCNHADGTCRNGNGWWSDKRKPCSYYTDKY
jgi:hypothetical protein